MVKKNQQLDSDQEILFEKKPTIDFESIFLNNDRVLVRYKKNNENPKEGVFVPLGQLGTKFYQGYVIKIGPGYPVPSFEEESSKDSILDKTKEIKGSHIPLQFRPGDLVVFDSKEVIDLLIDGEHYFIIKDQDVEMFIRDKDLFN